MDEKKQKIRIKLSNEKTSEVDPEVYKILLKQQKEIESLKNKSTSNIINLKRINDIRYINKFFKE